MHVRQNPADTLPLLKIVLEQQNILSGDECQRQVKLNVVLGDWHCSLGLVDFLSVSKVMHI